MIGEPPSLDPHATTATITREIGINMFETLYTLDAKFQPIPLLAEVTTRSTAPSATSSGSGRACGSTTARS